MIKHLKGYMEGYWKYVVIGTLAMVVEVACELMLPSIMAKIIDDAIPSGNINMILKMGALMLILTTFGMAGGITCAKYSSVASQGFAAKLRGGMFRKISDFSFHNIDTFSTASLTTRLTNDVTNLQMMIMMSLRILVRAPAMLILATVMAFSINAKLSGIIFFALPVILLAVGIIMKVGFPMFQKMQKRIDAVNSTVQENLIGIRVVKAFVREDYEKKKFKTANDNLMHIGSKASGMIVIAMPLMMLLFNVCIVVLIWRGGNEINNGILATGELMSLISYVMQILMSLVMVAMILIQVVRSKACAERISEVLQTKVDIENRTNAISPKMHCQVSPDFPDGFSKNYPENASAQNPGNAAPIPQISGKVEFRDVDFKYDTENSGDNILSNINFTAEPGEFVAVIGGTGSGKSSFVSLIPRLYDVTGGQVLVDGVDVRDYDLQYLRDQIGVVLQKNTLFSGTIRENLLWGNQNATQEDIEEACKASCADEFISAQPDGYETYLSQGGLNLSGGQKQRLCIARAMIKKPKILILDDSTSAVDTATEATIRASFSTTLRGTTVFIIAQRISSVEHADKIIVLDDGEIADVGTHEALLERSPIYQEINATQQKGVLS